jgi:hypothetical protein
LLSGPFPDFFDSLYDQRFDPGILFLSAAGKIARPVLEQHHEAKCHDEEQAEPENAPQKCHLKEYSLEILDQPQ